MNRHTYRNLMETIDEIRSNEQQLNERPTQDRLFYENVAKKLLDKHLNADFGEWSPSPDLPKLKIPKLKEVLKLYINLKGNSIFDQWGSLTFYSFKYSAIENITDQLQKGQNPEPEVKSYIEKYKQAIYPHLYQRWEYDRSSRAKKVLTNLGKALSTVAVSGKHILGGLATGGGD